MEKKYIAPKAEVVTFAKEDVITTSGFIFNWETPSIDLGGGSWSWDEGASAWN